MIPQGLTETHINQAVKLIDRDGVAIRRESDYYDLEIDGKRYPPKYVISLASCFAYGEEHSSREFNAVEAKKYFENRDYTIIDRRLEAKRSIVSEDDESSFPEGREKYGFHRRLERDASISRKAKANRLLRTCVRSKIEVSNSSQTSISIRRVIRFVRHFRE